MSIPEAGGDAVICILAVTLQATSARWIMEGQRYIVGLSNRGMQNVWLGVWDHACLWGLFRDHRGALCNGKSTAVVHRV